MLSPAFGSFSALDTNVSARGRLRRTTLAAAVDRLEREMIDGALQTSRGNISATARALGLTRRGLYLKMQRLKIRNELTSN